MDIINYLVKRPDENQFCLDEKIILPLLSFFAIFLNKIDDINKILFYSLFEEIVFRTIPFIIFDRKLKNCILSAIFMAYFHYYIADEIIYVFIVYFPFGLLYSIAGRKYSPIEMILHKFFFNCLFYFQR